MSKAEGYEIRLYEDRLAAQVRSNGGQNGSFRFLFQYISGANTSSEKVSMTVPVLQSTAENTGFMQFFLPKEFTSETAPQPTYPRVEIISVEGGYYAVRSYRGSATESNFARARTELLNALNADGHSVRGEVIRATYNGPFTLPFMRRNEAMVRIDAPRN